MGSLFSPRGRHVPSAPFLGSRSPNPAGHSSAFARGGLHNPPGPADQLWSGPPPCHAHTYPELETALGAPVASHTPSKQLWCIVVALHVLTVPVQCFHSASQRPAQPSRDSHPGLGGGPCPVRAQLSQKGRGEACVQLEAQCGPLTRRTMASLQKECVLAGQTVVPHWGLVPGG